MEAFQPLGVAAVYNSIMQTSCGCPVKPWGLLFVRFKSSWRDLLLLLSSGIKAQAARTVDGDGQQSPHDRQVLQQHRLLHLHLLRRETPAESGMENQGGRNQEKKEQQGGQSRFITKEHRQSSSGF